MPGRLRDWRDRATLALRAGLVLAWSAAAKAEEPDLAEAIPDSAEPHEVVVRGERSKGESRLTQREVRKLPGAFGDPLRAIEMLPGVTPTNNGLPYFYVRGAPPGNVGYFLDGVRVPELFHLALGPSVVHPGLIESVTLHSGPYPARYGRYAGAIVTAETAPPPADLGGSATLRAVDAGALATAPLDDHRGYAALAGRYSYTGAVLSLIVPELDVSYWDYQGLASYDVTARDTLGVLAFGASDFLSQRTSARRTTLYDAEFHRVDLRYDRRLGDASKLRIATTLGSDRSQLEEGQVRLGSRMAALRSELSTRLGDAVMLRAGADAEISRYRLSILDDPGSALAPEALVLPARTLPTRDDATAGAFLELELAVERRIVLRPGLRVDVFNSRDTTLVGVDPRVFADFEVNDRLSFVHGIGVAHQRPGFTFPLPGAQPVLDELQTSVQASSTVRFRFPEDVEASLTGFEAIHFGLTDPIAAARLQGRGLMLFPQPLRWLGRSYGVELTVQRSLAKKLGGYLAYTLSRAERSLGSLRIPSPFDRTHVVGAALAYDFGKGWGAGVRGSFQSGVPANVAYAEAARSPPRTPPFWRLDWRVEKNWLLAPHGSLSVVLEVLNTTLNRQVTRASCSAYVCRRETFAPVTVPSLGIEAKF